MPAKIRHFDETLLSVYLNLKLRIADKILRLPWDSQCLQIKIENVGISGHECLGNTDNTCQKGYRVQGEEWDLYTVGLYSQKSSSVAASRGNGNRECTR